MRGRKSPGTQAEDAKADGDIVVERDVPELRLAARVPYPAPSQRPRRTARPGPWLRLAVNFL